MGICLCLVCQSREKAAIPQQEQCNSAGCTPPGPLQSCWSRGSSQSQDSRSQCGHKRLFESHAEPWPQHAAGPKCRASTKLGTASTVPKQPIQGCTRQCLCASSSFQMHSQRVMASLICSEHLSSPSKELLRKPKLQTAAS